jgi:hypothetical protein
LCISYLAEPDRCASKAKSTYYYWEPNHSSCQSVAAAAALLLLCLSIQGIFSSNIDQGNQHEKWVPRGFSFDFSWNRINHTTSRPNIFGDLENNR